MTSTNGGGQSWQGAAGKNGGMGMTGRSGPDGCSRGYSSSCSSRSRVPRSCQRGGVRRGGVHTGGVHTGGVHKGGVHRGGVHRGGGSSGRGGGGGGDGVFAAVGGGELPRKRRRYS